MDLRIGGSAERPEVEARCISDGEAMAVEAIHFDGEALKFKTVVPSSGYATCHSMKPCGSDRCDHELTLTEVWKRTGFR